MYPFVYYFKIVYISKNTFCARAVIESISRVHRVNIEPLSRDNREQSPSVVVDVCRVVLVFGCRLLGGNAYRYYA